MNRRLLLSVFACLVYSCIWAQYPATSIDAFTLKDRKEATYHKMNSWDTSPFQEFVTWTTKGPNYWDVTEKLNCRLLYPKNYQASQNKRYPLVIMLHGAGESGRTWNHSLGHNYATTDDRYDNNDDQLAIGGQNHLLARNRDESNSRSLNAFVLFPQVDYNGGWSNGYDKEVSSNIRQLIELIEYFIAKEKVDQNRIYIQGISNGGRGVWDLLTRRPDLFAAASIMSAEGNVNFMAERLAHMPIRVFQGGQDVKPAPGASREMIKALSENGAVEGDQLKYLEYPSNGHNTWDKAFEELDFYSWFKLHQKEQIHVPFGRKEIPNTGGSIELQLSPEFLQYEWQKNRTQVRGAGGERLTVTAAGKYRARFRRKSGWSNWTPEVEIRVVANTTPVIKTVATQRKKPGDQVSLQIQASDSNGDQLTYTANGLPAGLIIDSNSGLISGKLSRTGTFESIVRVTDSGNPPLTSEISFKWVISEQSNNTWSVIYRVNSGGKAIADEPISWQQDLAGNSTSSYLDPKSGNTVTGWSIAYEDNTTDAPSTLFGTNRYQSPWGGDPVKYNFPVSPNAPHLVTLYFAEKNDSKVKSGERSFAVKIENETVLSNFDVVVEGIDAGSRTVSKSFEIVPSDDVLSIQLLKQSDLPPIISGISIASSAQVLSVNPSRTSSWEIFPNPVSSQLSIKSPNAKLESFEVYDLQSRKVLASPIVMRSNELSTLELSKLKPGLYLLSVLTHDQQVVSFRILKQ